MISLKTNFKKPKKSDERKSEENTPSNENSSKDITQQEFEEFIIKSGAKGSFMVYRSKKEDEELGIDEL